MTLHYLKFPDEATAIATLADYYDATAGKWRTASHAHTLDPVGTIYQPTGDTTTDEDGNTVPVMAAIEGWHGNFIGSLPAGAEAYVVHPVTPVRVFAGMA